MINMPLSQIKERISQKTDLSEQEIDDKIAAKLKQLSGLISREGAAHIIANELGVKLFKVGEQMKIKDVLSGMRDIDVVGKVVQKYELREFKTEKHEGKVANMLIGDDTGVIRVVMWHNQAENINKVEIDDVVKIKGGYVRDNQGRKEIHLSDSSKVLINPEGVDVDVKPYTPSLAVRRTIADIKEDDENVEILATIVQVFDINFFEVCPQCKKRIRLKDEGFTCTSHGKVEPEFNYVLNLYLDDGSDNIRAVFWREQVNQLLDMSSDSVLGFKEDPSKFEAVKNDLLGNIIKVEGRPKKNQNFDRVELVVSNVEKNPDPDEEIKKLKQEADKVLSEEDAERDTEQDSSQTQEQSKEPIKESKEKQEEEQKKQEEKKDGGQEAGKPEKKSEQNQKSEQASEQESDKKKVQDDDLEDLDLDKELEDIE